MRVLFMGTPEIAVPVLEKLNESHEIVGVFCQPDKPQGRKMVLTPPPTKVFAMEHGIPVYQPERLRRPEVEELIRSLDVDAAAVIAYGKILPRNLLELPKYGCINAHASLLPKYRGAAPIQRAIIDGETETGITAMLMDPGMDTGDAVAVKKVPILPEDDAVSMFDKLGDAAAELMDEVFSDLPAYIESRTPQDHDKATMAPMLEKTDGDFAFDTHSAKAIFDLVRGTAIWPVARFYAGERMVKVFKCALRTDLSGKAGEVIALKPLTIAAEGGAVELLELMPQNSKRMDGTSFAAGMRLKAGDILK